MKIRHKCFSVGFAEVCIPIPWIDWCSWYVSEQAAAFNIRCADILPPETCCGVVAECFRAEKVLFSWSLPAKTWRLLDLCSPPIDDTPPEPGTVTVKWLPWGVLHMAWDGFKEEQSRISNYAYCLGTTPNGCDLAPMRDVGRSVTATVTGVGGIAGDPLYVVVRCTNTQKLATSVTVKTSFAAGASEFQRVAIRNPITDNFVDVSEATNVWFFTNATENDFLLQLYPVQDGVNVTGLEWAFVNETSLLADAVWQPVGRFDQLKQDPSAAFELTVDLQHHGMAQGRLQYLVFKAENSLNEVAQVVVRVVLDTVKPLPTNARAVEVTATGWSLSPTSISACWTFFFWAAPVNQFDIRLRDIDTGDVMTVDPVTGQPTRTLAVTRYNCALLPRLPLQDGHRYVIQVLARSESGMINSHESDPVPVDSTLAQCEAGFSANVAPTVVSLYARNATDNEAVTQESTSFTQHAVRQFVPDVTSLRFAFGCEDRHSGLLDVQYAITTSGTFATRAGSNTSVILPLQDGSFGVDRFDLRSATVLPSQVDGGVLPIHSWLFGIVQARNGADAIAAGVAGAVLIDPTPPVLNGSNVAIVDGASEPSFDASVLVYQSSMTQLSVLFEGAFQDQESGITHYEVSHIDLGLHPQGKPSITIPSRATVLQQWNSSSPTTHHVGLRTAYNVTSLELEDGHVYVVTVVAFNGAGLRTSAVTGAILVDGSPPPQHGAWVDDRYTDGNCGETGVTACHVYQASLSGLRVWWGQDFNTGTSKWDVASVVDDPDSGLIHLELGVFRVPNPSDPVDQGTLVSRLSYVPDPARRALWFELHKGVLRHSLHYRVRVTAVNRARLRTDAYTNVITIDTTAPVVHNVTDAFANTNGVLGPTTDVALDTVSGAWQVFAQSVSSYQIQIDAADTESPPYWNVWSIGTSPGDNDVQLDTGVCVGDVDGGSCGDFPECRPVAAGCPLEGPQFVPVKAGTVADFVGMLLFTKVQVYNQAALSTSFVTPGRLVDEDNPIIGAVLDGWERDAQFVSVDEGKVFVSWIGVEDKTTAVVHRSYAITTTPDAPPAAEFSPVSDAVDTRAGFNFTLVHGTRYYVHLRVGDKSGRTAQASSTGALVDFCPPVIEWVRFVDKALNLRFQNTTNCESRLWEWCGACCMCCVVPVVC